MSTAYVYAPLTSQVYLTHQGGGGYCNGGTAGFDCLQGGSQWSSVKFYASSNVKSVRFTQTNNCAPGCSQPHRNAVKAELYSGYDASGCLFGWVLYGHLNSPIGNSVWNLNWGITVGYVVDFVAGQCPYYNDNDHVHMEVYRGTRLVNTWYQQLYQGNTPIYQFTGAIC